MNMIKNEYKFNSDFREYVDEYCEKHECTLEDAFNDEDIKQIFWKYTEV